MDDKMVIIGGGPAGIEAALTAAKYTQDVTLITNNGVGEWKFTTVAAWLNALSSAAPFHDIHALSPRKVNEHAREVQQRWSHSLYNQIQKAGIKLINGQARFQSVNRIAVQQDDPSNMVEIQADKVIIATGSRPTFPEHLQPDGKQIFSYDTYLEELPQSILVIGDGPIGFEVVNILSKLRVKVQWLVKAGGPTCFFDPDIDNYFNAVYRVRGVQIVSGEWITRIQKGTTDIVAYGKDGSAYRAETGFVTLGFRSNVDFLNVEQTGLEMNKFGSVDCDPFGRTAVESIYVVGDSERILAGVYAMAKARVAALHAVGQHPSPVDVQRIPLAFNEGPQAAKVGLVDAQTPGVHSRIISFADRNFQAYVYDQCDGFLKILWNDEGKIVGGTAVGLQAKELISTLAMMIHQELKINDFHSFFGAHPSGSELLIHSLHAIADDWQ